MSIRNCFCYESRIMNLKNIYNHKWFPRLFYFKPDGGKDSGVTAYFLIEWKKVFSIGLLHFKKGSRESFHNHAFNALTWWLKGKVTEETFMGYKNDYIPSLKPKYTKRSNMHKVIAHTDTWALTFRGPWNDTWREFRSRVGFVTLTHGRVEL